MEKSKDYRFHLSSDIMVIDRAGYRLNVGIILSNGSGRVFWGRRSGHDAWQFPQGGVATGETALEAMFRELHEEIGLMKEDVEVMGFTRRWLKYKLPKQYLQATNTHDSRNAKRTSQNRHMGVI